MDNQTSQKAVAGHPAATSSNPHWWRDEHATAWARVKEALRRDWEQTRADLSPDGDSLNQTAFDTVLQASGADPMPPRVEKTRPDAPTASSKHAEKEFKSQVEAQDAIALMRTDIALKKARVEAKVARVQHHAQAEIDREQKKIGEIAEEARETIARDERKAQEALVKQNDRIAALRVDVVERVAHLREASEQEIAAQRQKIDAARRNWAQVEAAVRYGFGSRMEYPPTLEWDPHIEDRLRVGWTDLETGSPWEDAYPYVRHGWNSMRGGGAKST